MAGTESDPAAPAAFDEAEVSELKPAQAANGLGALAMGNYMAQGARLAFSIVVAQVLGPAGRGAVALVSVLDESSSAVLTLGAPIAAGFRAKVADESDQSLINASFRLGIALTPIALAVGLLCSVVALGRLEQSAQLLTILLVAWTGVVNLPGLAAANIVQARGKLRQLAVFPVLYPVVSIVVVVSIVLIGGLTVTWVVVGFVLGRLLTAAYGLVVTAWPAPGPYSPIGSLLSYGVRALPASAGALLNNRLDQLIIAPMVSLRELGFYAVAAGTSFLPTVLALSMGSAAFARVRPDQDRGRCGSASTAIRRGLLVTSLAAVALGLAAPFLVPIVYGSSFSSAVVPTEILLVGSIPWGGQLVARQCANALNRPSDASAGEIFGLVVTILGLLVAGPVFGIIGAAVVSVFAYVARFAVTVKLLRRVGVRSVIPWIDDVRWLMDRVSRTVRVAAARGRF